ncbi:MAG: hypothetical protein HGA22_13145, partial [Clostridiales bacterium]|nr:hypothetical protein [Clostridiales bacterium]
DNFTRGKKLREIFGGDLPPTFPVLSGFKDGTALMIKSMDITAWSFSNEREVTDTIIGYVKLLSNYKGQEEPWGSGDITISPADIKNKKLILILPENEAAAEIEQALEKCVEKALSYGVELKIERYGMKVTE